MGVMKEATKDPEVWQLWKDRALIGAENPEHATGLRGCAFGDLDFLSDPIYVQEIYIMDNFMRALAEFRSPQGPEQTSIPIPCSADEPLKAVKRRLFEQIRHNFVALQEVPPATMVALYGREYGDRDPAWIRPYSWVGTLFTESWTEADLKWFVYQDYDSFLDPDMWQFYGPDLTQPLELYDETKLFRVKRLIANFKKHLNLTKSHDGLAKATSLDAIYLLPTHIRVMLWRDGFDLIMYTLPRETTYEALKQLVEGDLDQPGIFTKFDCGPPENRFGPGKSFADVFPPTTVGVSHAWA